MENITGGEIVKVDVRGRIRTKRERRAELLAEFDRSGMSGPQFAQWAGIKYTTFASWRQKQQKELAAVAKEPSTVKPVQWVEAVVREPAASPAKSWAPFFPTHPGLSPASVRNAPRKDKPFRKHGRSSNDPDGAGFCLIPTALPAFA